MTGPAPRRFTPLHLLVLGQMLIGTASWASLIAIQTKASYDLHQGAVFLAAAAMAWGAPTILFSPLVGRAIDTLGPRTVGIVSCATSVAAAAGLAVTGGSGALWAMTLVSGIARAFAQPSVDAMPSWLPGPAEHVKSSVWLGFATSVPMIAGPTLAAGFIAGWGVSSAFALTAVAYLLGGSVFVLLRLQRRAASKEKTAGGGLRMRSLLASWTLRVTVILTLIVWISYGAFTPLEILYVKTVLNQPAGTFATIEIVFGSGLVAATLLVARFAFLLEHRFFLPGSVLLIGAAEVLYVYSDRLPVAYAGVCLWGLGAGLFGPGCRLALLNGTAVEQHGRAMALWRAVQSFGTLVPPIASGMIAHFAGVQTTLIWIGAIVAVTGAATWILIGLRPPAPDPRPQEQTQPEPAQSPAGDGKAYQIT